MKNNGNRPAKGYQYYTGRRITIRLDEEMWEEIAEGVKISMSQRIKELIEWGLEAERENK